MKTYLNKSDQIQRDKIIELLSTNMAVEAGAGAGKTTIIVKRIINQLKDTTLNISPKELVVITFTNAATEEIRSRIIESLDEERKKEKNLIIKEKLNKAFIEIYSMNISTIHSFCNKLLFERCFDAKIPIGAKLLDDKQEKERINNLFNEWFKQIKEKSLKELITFHKDTYNLRNRLFKAFVKIYSKGEGLNIICPVINLDDTYSNLKKIYLRIQSNLLSYNSDEYAINKDGKAFFEILVNDLSDKIDYDSINSLKTTKKSLSDFLGSRYILSNVKHKQDNQTIKEFIISIIDDYNKYHYDLVSYINGLSFKYAFEAYNYAIENRTRDVLSNDQLISETKKLIDNDAARLYFADKIRCIYVDEFQDTDINQEHFIWKLAAKKDDINQLRDGALFVVGDPKQSIYRFRGADPEVYFTNRKKMEKLNNAEIFFLTKNFRSNNEIIDSVNKMFEDKDIIANGKYSPMEVPSSHIVPTKDDNDKQLSGMYIMNYHNVIELNDNKKGDLEPVKVACLIRKLIDEKFMICKQRKDYTYYFDFVNYSDILVLIGIHAGMQKFLDAFNQYNIPTTITGEVLINHERLVFNYIRMLKALILKDDLSFYGGVELLRYSAIKYPSSYTLESQVEDYYKDLLNKIIKKTDNMSSYGKAMYLYHHLDLILEKDIEIEKSIYLSIQTKIQQMIETVFASDYLNGNELINKLYDYVSIELKSELSLLEDNNSVRVMNVHSSKGLEGNIVIWANNDHNHSFKSDDYRKGKDFYPCFEDWCSYMNNQEIYNSAFLEHDQEDCRLEYVGATRARQVLIFSDEITNNYLFKRDNYNYDLNGFKSFEFDLFNQEIINDLNVVDYRYENESINKDLYAKVYEKLSPSSLDNSISSTRDSIKQDLINKGVDIFADLNNRPIGNILGTILHRSLELFVNRFDKSNIKYCINQALIENNSYVDNKDNYINFMDAVLNSYYDFIVKNKYFDNAKQIITELPYSYYQDNKWINGSMDLVIIFDDRALIIDYKSDVAEYIKDEDLFATTLIEKYKGQLDLYKKSLNHLYNIDIEKIKTKIIYFRHYKDNNVDINEKEL